MITIEDGYIVKTEVFNNNGNYEQRNTKYKVNLETRLLEEVIINK